MTSYKIEIINKYKQFLFDNNYKIKDYLTLTHKKHDFSKKILLVTKDGLKDPVNFMFVFTISDLIKDYNFRKSTLKEIKQFKDKLSVHQVNEFIEDI